MISIVNPKGGALKVIHQNLLLSLFILITTLVCTIRVEAAQSQVDRQLRGESRPATGNKLNPSEDTKWGYCYEPDTKIIGMNDHTYRSYHCEPISGWTGYFEIYYKDRKVYSEGIDKGDFSVCDVNDTLSKCLQVPPPGTDINGDSVPEMVMERHTGQPQFTNYYSYPIYSIGKKVQKLVTIRGMHSPMQFKDLDGDGLYEVIGNDWVLAYYFGDFTSSPHPIIILKWQKSGYRLDFKLMKKLPPAYEELKKKAEDLRRSFENANGPFPEGYIFDIPDYQHADAWNYLVDLIYSGNAKAAWTFLDMYWIIPPGCTEFKEKKQEKRKFMASFKKQLARSLYWKDLKALNSGVIN